MLSPISPSMEQLTNGSFGKRPRKAKEERRGPYSSIASVTLMIARQLKKDITKRVAVHQLPE
jgi:hypothetical protein